MDNDAKLRPLYLAKILYERTDEEHFLSTAQLISILESEYSISSHRQTIKTDIDLLRRFGLDIQEIKSTQNKYNLLDRPFDNAELRLLIDAVVSSKFITKHKSEELAEKLSMLSGTHGSAKLKRNISCEGRIKTGNEKIYLIVDTINEAINAGRKISFQYFKYNANKEKLLKNDGKSFIITPLYLIWNGDYYYMLGVYDYKQRLGSFRVDRIAKRPTILDEAGTPAADDFDLNAHLSSTFRMYGSYHSPVELVCDNDVAEAIIDRFGEDTEFADNENGTFTASVEVAVSHVFYSWVFGFGGKVKIKSPEKVKNGYIQMVKNAIDE